ncbi:MAG: ATP-binding protein, partial [Candidatus Omnitrophota bacterium]
KHKQFRLERFPLEEGKILQGLSREWYLTNSGAHLTLAKDSEYDFFLMKPTPAYTQMFNIDRELIVVFSKYSTFETRTLDAFDAAQKLLSDLRTENVCRILISADPKIESKIETRLKSNPEEPIVIPFTYGELSGAYDSFLIRNRFRRHFYTRDLFAFASPLTTDLYFFGRTELIQNIINRHRTGEHSGLFGLRKSGKTSIIFAIERRLLTNEELFISLDCENPSIHQLRWNELLRYLVTQCGQAKDKGYRAPLEERYSAKNAAESFGKDMLRIYKLGKQSSTLILFDEIERISPGVGASPHWAHGDDFVYFWQTMRAFFQRNQGILTYMIVGTNPNCIEASMIGGHENPLFGSIPYQYVPAFNLDEVKQMVLRLGNYMGLQFDQLIYSKLTDDFGGHPFLIRQICSMIHCACVGDRPAKVDKALYDRIKAQFLRESVGYFDMIIQVLQIWYPDEYEMLCMLAQGDDDGFNQFALAHGQYTKHLIGYGLIQSSANGYSFSIEAIRQHLNNKHKHERMHLSQEEKLAEISARRNKCEKTLRFLMRNILRTAYGKRKATDAVIASLPEDRRAKMASSDWDALLDRDKCELFFLDLITLIFREWPQFQNVFDMAKDRAHVMLIDINQAGRSDCHAKGISEEDFLQIRLHFKKLESIMAPWELR